MQLHMTIIYYYKNCKNSCAVSCTVVELKYNFDVIDQLHELTQVAVVVVVVGGSAWGVGEYKGVAIEMVVVVV